MGCRLEKLIEQYKKELAARKLQFNARLESVRDLALNLQCSPTTAAKIFRQLEKDGLVSAVPGKGYFFRQPPVRKQKIGYLGNMPTPLLDPIAYDAVSGLLDHLESQSEYEVFILQFRAMQKFDMGCKLLQSLDGLLVHASYIDPKTIPVLRNFNKPIVVMGAQYQNNQIICSQVMADFSTAIQQLFACYDPKKYSKIVILQTQQKNSEATAQQIINFLKISDLNIPIELEKTDEPAAYGNIMYGYDRIKNMSKE